MQDIIRELLTELGEDPSREGLLDTPKRVEKSLRFLTSGYAADSALGMTIRDPSRLTSKLAWPKLAVPFGTCANAVSRDTTRIPGVVSSRASTIAVPDV